MAGKLKVILGYAAGVGKTYRMLSEGQQLAAAGHDVVIGYFEPHARPDTMALTQGLPEVPCRSLEYRGLSFREMDTDAILVRRPAICLVDEFAHTNVPGSARLKRWEDVLVLLAAGIDVITTMNIQHLESLNDQIREITGVSVRETVPDWVLQQAEELVLVDLTPTALLNRLDRGVVYSPEKAQRAKENFFRPPILAALREMALRQAAHEVDLRQPNPFAPAALLPTALLPTAADAAATHAAATNPLGPVSFASKAVTAEVAAERILIHVTESPASAALLRRGHRVAAYLRAPCFAVALTTPQPSATQAATDSPLQQHLAFARKLHIETRQIPVNPGEDAAQVLVDFARRHGITQLFVAKPALPFGGRIYLRRPLALRILALAKGLQVTIVADRKSS